MVIYSEDDLTGNSEKAGNLENNKNRCIPAAVTLLTEPQAYLSGMDTLVLV